MKALVTGGNGLIGSNLVRLLLSQGHEARVLTRQDSDLSSLSGVDCEIAVGDVLDGDSIQRAARGCDQLFHTAAIFAYHGYSEHELRRVAVDGTRTVLGAVARADIGRVVLTSSSVVCGSSRTTRPRTEEDEIDTPDAPAYDLAKAMQEQVAFELAQELDLNLMAVCPAMTVGPHDTRLTPSNALIVRYLEDPFHLSYPGGCNVVSVRDVAQAHLRVAERGRPGERYLVGGDNLEWSLLYRYISELSGVAPPTIPVGHAASYLMASAHELSAWMRGKTPPANRVQAKTLGEFYWYDCSRIAELGVVPRSTRAALAEAIGWLSASALVSRELRSTLSLSREVWESRRGPELQENHGAL